MELNLLQNIAQAAPGFVGVAACKLMNGNPQKEKLNNEVLAYFLFGGTAWLLVASLDNICSLQGLALSESTRIACTIICAALLGILWPVWLRDKAVALANIINCYFGKNPIFVEETILEKLGCDNKPHYYEAYKSGTLVASGWGEHFIRSEKSFSLRQIEGYGVANWILMDYNDIIVHIFSDESRTFYDLERIWRDGKEVSVGEFETEE